MSKILRKLLNLHLFFIIFIVIITLFIFRELFSEGYPSWADNSAIPVLNMGSFYSSSNFTYSERFHGLVYNSNEILMNFLPNKIASVFNIFFSEPRVLSIIWVVLPYITLNICLYFSFFNVFHKKRLSFLLTLFYIFSPWNLSLVAYGWSWTTYSIASGILFLSYFIRYLENPKFKNIVAMSLLSILGFINIAAFYAVLLCAFMYFLIHMLVNKLTLSEIYSLYKKLLLLPLIIFLINFYWILPIFPMSRELNSGFDNLPQIYPTSILTHLNTFFFTTNFSSFGEFLPIFNFFNSFLFRIIYILFLLAVLWHILKNISHDNKLKIYLSMYLLIFGLSLGVNFRVLWIVFQSLPGAFMIRSPQLKFYPILFFLLALLVGQIIQKYNLKKFVYFAFLVVFFGIIGFVRSGLFSYWSNITPPEDYKEVVKVLNSPDNKYFTVAEFPEIWGTTKISWLNDRYATSILNSMIYNPLIIYNKWNTAVIPEYLKEVYANPFTNIPEILGRGGVKYVLVHKDYSNFHVKQDFSSMEGLSKVVGGSNIDLFEVSDFFYKGLFYSGEKNLEYERINPVMHVFKVKPGEQITFNRQHDISLKLYDKKDIEEVGYYGCKFSIGDLNFCDILLLKVKPLPKQSLGKDYKNNWILPENSSGSYVVYYEPQIYFYIGLIISFIAFILHILYLLVAKESDKNKEMGLN